jgi:hypothetical protein
MAAATRQLPLDHLPPPDCRISASHALHEANGVKHGMPFLAASSGRGRLSSLAGWDIE